MFLYVFKGGLKKDNSFLTKKYMENGQNVKNTWAIYLPYFLVPEILRVF